MIPAAVLHDILQCLGTTEMERAQFQKHVRDAIDELKRLREAHQSQSLLRETVEMQEQEITRCLEMLDRALSYVDPDHGDGEKFQDELKTFITHRQMPKRGDIGTTNLDYRHLRDPIGYRVEETWQPGTTSALKRGEFAARGIQAGGLYRFTLAEWVPVRKWRCETAGHTFERNRKPDVCPECKKLNGSIWLSNIKEVTKP